MVEAGQRVSVHFTGMFDDGSEFDSSMRRGGPVEFVVGSRTMLPAFEKAVVGMEAGEERTVRIPAEGAYGAYDESLVEKVPVAALPDAERLPVGGYIAVSTDAGPMRVKVEKVESGYVHLDCNHELAGRDLVFRIRLVGAVHESAVDLERHPAGCACGCDRLKRSLSAS